jgi:hypothetical protein
MDTISANDIRELPPAARRLVDEAMSLANEGHLRAAMHVLAACDQLAPSSPVIGELMAECNRRAMRGQPHWRGDRGG